MIDVYFSWIRTIIGQFSHIITQRSLVEKVYHDELGFIEGRLQFTDDSRLEFGELKNGRVVSKPKYRYQYMNRKNELIFRYDNAKHYPDLPNFPHHKHSPGGVEASTEPTLENVLEEIQNLILDEE